MIQYRLLLICMFCMCVCMGEVSAAVANFTSAGEYVMSNVDTLEISETYALEYAKQAAIEKAGVYVENYTRTEDLQVVEDDIRVITSQQIKVINKNTSKIMLSNGDIKIRVEILAEVDTSDIDEYMKIREDVRENIKRQYYALEREKSNLDIELIELKNKIKNGTIDDVEAEREKMRQDREYKAVLMLKQGLVKWKNADYDGVINTNEEALKLNPKYAFAYNNCAVAYEAYGNFEEAFKKYDFATIINPSYAEPYYNRGNVYYKLEKLDEAIKEYKKALECNPKFAQAYGNLGVVYGDLGEYDKSIECLEKALDIEELNKTFMHNLIITRAKKEGKFSIEKIW